MGEVFWLNAHDFVKCIDGDFITDFQFKSREMAEKCGRIGTVNGDDPDSIYRYAYRIKVTLKGNLV